MPSSLGNKIHSRRTELKLSLDQLAAITDSSKSYVWELENRDDPNPSADKLAKIAAALNVTPDFLLVSGETTPDQAVEDQAFFRKYQQLDEPAKARLRKVLDIFDDEV